MPPTSSAACRLVEVGGDATSAGFTMLVLYPSSDAEQEERFGLYTMRVAMHGRLKGNALPLVVISHGSGGSYLTHRTLARHLARSGFVVVVPEHPGNNRNDNRLADTEAILASRPVDVRRAIDWACADPTLGPALAPGVVGIVGHSLGGYTALALAGGRPIANPKLLDHDMPRPVPVVHDDRIKAVVLLAPATPWFRQPDALRGVRAPILMLTAEHDELAPAWHGAIVVDGVAAGVPVEHRVVSNAGHFSFLSPFPPHMTTPLLAPSMDAPGFDRGEFHEEMNAEIAAFLRRVLG